MARSQGIVRLIGTIDGVTYTEGVYGRIIRSKSSLDKAKMDSNPKYDILRLYQRELSLFSKYGSLLRSGISAELNQVKVAIGAQRLNKLLVKLKDLDRTNRLGARIVSEGMKTPRGKVILKNFDFYGNTKLSSLLSKTFELDKATGTISIADFNPAKDVFAPKKASHVQFKALLIGLDAETSKFCVQRSVAVNLALVDATADLVLAPIDLPRVTTQVFYVVQVLFYKETNGFQDLTARRSATLTILEVG